MLATIALCLLAGFFVGNALPYYLAGSTGKTTNPSPFPDGAIVNVLIGCAQLGIGGLLWSVASVSAHEAVAWLAGLAGLLAVGLIHARVWNGDPWRKHRQPPSSEGAASPAS